MVSSTFIRHQENFPMRRDIDFSLKDEQTRRRNARKAFPESSGVITSDTFSSKISYHSAEFMAKFSPDYINPLRLIETLFDQGKYSKKFESYPFSSIVNPEIVFHLKKKEQKLRGRLACTLGSVSGGISIDAPITFYEADVGIDPSDKVYRISKSSVYRYNLYNRRVEEVVGVELGERERTGKPKVIKPFTYEQALAYLKKELQV